jgi:hypothetical protein
VGEIRQVLIKDTDKKNPEQEIGVQTELANMMPRETSKSKEQEKREEAFG